MIDEKVITSSENVTLLALEIGSKLNIDEHISKLCNKSAGQLNALCRIGHLIGLEERKIQWNLYKADTIRSKKKCPLYGDVRFIEFFPKTQLFSKI